MSDRGDPRDVAHLDPVLAAERPIGRRRGDRIVGAGRATLEAVEQARLAARSERPVLITGPAGSGREHFARAIHAWSGRASGPFVVVECGAVPESLLGRELFGCSASVYPQMPDDYTGALSRAGTGTAVLASIDRCREGQLEPLAKAIGDGRFQREGDGATSSLRSRIIATALARPQRPPFGGAPLHEIELTPLSERREDVLPLAAHFLRLAADEEGVRPIGFTSDARAALLSEPWPGNVRELFERVRQAVRLAGEGAISAEALLLAADGENVPSFKEAKRAFETRYVVGLLRRCGGNISRAARLAKKDRKDFYDVIRRTGVNPADYR